VSLEYGSSTSRFPNEDSLRRFVTAVEREVQGGPGVKSGGWTTGLPLDGIFSRFGFDIVGDEAASPSNRPIADYNVITPTYLKTVDIPVLAGRGFTEQDSAMSVPVCLVSEGFVRRYLPTTNPIGMRIAIGRIQLGPSPPVVREIVGVVRQVKSQPTEVDDPAQVSVHFGQDRGSFAALAVRQSGGRADAMATAVRAAVARV